MPLKQFSQERSAMHEVGQKCFQQNNAFRMTEIGHECHRDDYSLYSSILVSEHSVMCVFDCACDARACAILHNESLIDERCFQQRKQAEW